MRIAVLALQGAFIEHEKMLQRLGAETFEVRQLSDWYQTKDALVIPGGESTTQIKLLHELNLYNPVREAILSGLPVFGTCAGLILLAKSVVGEEEIERISTMDISVCRNAYGRQLGSFHTTAELKGIGNIPMTFIRAPYVVSAADDVEILATVEDRIVAVRYNNQLALAFHPELDESNLLHKEFLRIVADAK